VCGEARWRHRPTFVKGDKGVMLDTTLGGSQHEILYSLKDQDGNVVNTCTDSNKVCIYTAVHIYI
jgi:hypothetical protein